MSRTVANPEVLEAIDVLGALLEAYQQEAGCQDQSLVNRVLETQERLKLLVMAGGMVDL